jgi:hypothetical protein
MWQTFAQFFDLMYIDTVDSYLMNKTSIGERELKTGKWMWYHIV